MTPPLAVLLQSLRMAGLDIDAEAALDSLWLGSQIRDREGIGRGASYRPPDGSVASDPGTSGTPRPSGGDTRPSSDRLRRDSLSIRTAEFATPAAASTGDAAAPARTVTLARAAALPTSRELIKALRPLRRRVISPGGGILDVDATVRRAAEEDLWFPTFASARERWLDVLLVADHGLSMIFWKDTIDEFERVLRNAGAFRSVRSWWLESDADAPAITARGRGPIPATPERLVRQTRGAGRSVVLVVSDCVGPRWHDGTIPRLVGAWSRVLPVALLQVTPEWFWSRTALGDTVGSRFRSSVPAAVNHRFHWDATALGAGGVTPEEERTLLRVPAATLTGNAVARIARLIAGVGREWAPGVVFDLNSSLDDEPAPGPAPSPEVRVVRFRTLASTAAQRLAGAFAASPVRTLGVLRLLRRDLLPEASPFVEAEVMLGGIVRVRREEAQWDLGTDLPLEFVPGVQSLLLDGAVAGDVVRVLRHAASVAESGVGPTFTAWLENPSSGAGQIDAAESAFSGAVAHVLARLGGAYAQMVKPGSRPVHEPRARAESTIEHVSTDELAASVGRPHGLPRPTAFSGREAELHRIDSWLTDSVGQREMMVVGPTGIGKTAIAAQTVLRWRERWPDDEPFVWCFQRDPTSGEMFRLMRDHFAGERTAQGSDATRELLDALARRPRSLIVLDGIDGIEDLSELSQVLTASASIATITTVRVLLTGREPPGNRTWANQLWLSPLTRENVDTLARELVRRSGGPDRSDDEMALLTQLASDVAAGNPLVIRTLIGHSAGVGGSDLLEELAPDAGDGRVITPNQLPAIEARLDQAARARELSEIGSTLYEAGNGKQALKAFDDVVAIRGRLPSRRLRARALFDRGYMHMATADYERAAADLADAVGLYRSISANNDEMVRALDQLARARSHMGRSDESADLVREALQIARTLENSAGVIHLLIRLGTLQMQQGSLIDALGSLGEALAESLAQGDAHSTGLAYLAIGRVHQRLDDHSRALPAVYSAIDALRQTADSTALAEAYDVLITLHESSGNLGGVGVTLEGLKELRPDQAASIDERLRDVVARMNAPAPQHNAEPAAQPPDVLDGDDERHLTVEFLISGRVQGVGFRTFAQRCFQEIGSLTGDARDLRDGRVRVRASGPRPRLKELRDRLSRGPLAGTVNQVTTTKLDDAPPTSA